MEIKNNNDNDEFVGLQLYGVHVSLGFIYGLVQAVFSQISGLISSVLVPSLAGPSPCDDKMAASNSRLILY